MRPNSVTLSCWKRNIFDYDRPLYCLCGTYYDSHCFDSQLPHLTTVQVLHGIFIGLQIKAYYIRLSYLQLPVYIDAHLAGCLDSSHSTTWLRMCLGSVHCKTQYVNSKSFADSGFITVSSAASKFILSYVLDRAAPLHSDNTLWCSNNIQFGVLWVYQAYWNWLSLHSLVVFNQRYKSPASLLHTNL